MSSKPESQSEGTTYVGFDMESPEDKTALHHAAIDAGYTNLAPFVRELVYDEVDSLDSSDS